MSKVFKLLIDYRNTLVWKCNSLRGFVGNCVDVNDRQKHQRRIVALTNKIAEIDFAIKEQEMML